MSASYLDDKGIVPNSGFQRYSARLKADYQVKPWLKWEEMYHLLIMIAVNRILRVVPQMQISFMRQILWELFILCMFVMHRAILW